MRYAGTPFQLEPERARRTRSLSRRNVASEPDPFHAMPLGEPLTGPSKAFRLIPSLSRSIAIGS